MSRTGLLHIENMGVDLHCTFVFTGNTTANNFVNVEIFILFEHSSSVFNKNVAAR